MKVVAVSAGKRHGPLKPAQASITLVAGHGVEGDAHFGATVQHLSRKRWRPHLPNLRQVHLMHEELHEELRAAGFDAVVPGRLGENVTTRGLDLLALPTRARLRLGGEAVVEITGLRNPCVQLDRIQPGLMEATLDRGPDGDLVRRAGIMGIVLEGGEVRAGDTIAVELPPEPHQPLAPV
jgi:MOSC domain-containing protein YiiM